MSKIFKDKNWWHKYWQDMPEFELKNKKPFLSITVHFKTQKDLEKFSKLVDQRIYKGTKSIWFPKRYKHTILNIFWDDEKK